MGPVTTGALILAALKKSELSDVEDVGEGVHPRAAALAAVMEECEHSEHELEGSEPTGDDIISDGEDGEAPVETGVSHSSDSSEHGDSDLVLPDAPATAAVTVQTLVTRNFERVREAKQRARIDCNAPLTREPYIYIVAGWGIA